MVHRSITFRPGPTIVGQMDEVERAACTGSSSDINVQSDFNVNERRGCQIEPGRVDGGRIGTEL